MFPIIVMPAGVSAADNDVTRCTTKFQPLSKVRRDVFDRFKAMQSMGLYPPIRVTKNDIEGFIVVADDRIKKGSLITEYTGVVQTLHEGNLFGIPFESLFV